MAAVENPSAARRTVIVVGATGDIGQSVALRMDAAGYDMLLTYCSSSPTYFTDQRWKHMNVGDPTSVRKVLETESTAQAPYALIYCSGIVRDGPFALLKPEQWDEVMDVNLRGAFMCVRAVARAMMVARVGRIVLVGSVAGRRAQPGQAAYAASKAALESMSRTVALEFGRYGITCNVVVPGAIESKMFRATRDTVVRGAINGSALRRLGEPRHVAAAVAYLLSEDADFITGQCLVVDGGLTLS